ncbi:MAG: S8 family serine peptidase [Corynebacterium casei]|uniref:S8 family serine peptidase n=1 Tax=Corynebacterium stationis TaxID=1705 RepID=UPI0026FF7825|nr:S8 family serine peptidase [Corynebacterium stationis]MDO5507263.1 S8 family serine peptidase [Corynebacterium casei]WLP87906.1 S8 family serine peptidase [Corynebacterium stationis]
MKFRFVSTLDEVERWTVVLAVVISLFGAFIAPDFLSGSSSTASTASSVPKVVFIDDGLSRPDNIETIVLNPDGEPGQHFDGLFQSFVEAHSQQSNILVIDVVGSFGQASPDSIADAVNIAIDEGADIINISLASEKASMKLESAIQAADERNIAVIASTQSGLEKVVSYPAAFESVIGVYPLSSDGTRYWFSNSVGADIGVIVPVDGGSSLGAVLTTAQLLNCTSRLDQPKEKLVAILLQCQSPIFSFHRASP